MDRINAWMIISLLVLIGLWAVAANQFFIATINADNLFGFETAKTLLHTRSLAGQNFPIAPYYFPDLLLIACLTLFTTNIAMLHYSYSLIFLTAYFYIIYRLFTATGFEKITARYGSLFCMICYFCILPENMSFLREWSLSHQSVILVSLLCFYLYLKQPNSWFSYGLIVILQFLCFASDKLLFAQSMAPFCLILLYDYYYEKIKLVVLLRFYSAFLVIFISGAFINDFLAHHYGASYSYDISLYRIRKIVLLPETLGKFLGFLQVSYTHNKIFYWFLLAYNGVITVFFIYLIKQKKTEDRPLYKLLVFLLLAQIINGVLAILSGKLTDANEEHFRYIDTVFMYPSVMMSLLLIRYYSEIRWVRGFMVTIIFFAFAVFFYSNMKFLYPISFKRPYNHAIYCIDELAKTQHLTQGLAEYWYVRPIRMLTREGLKLSQVDEQFKLLNKIDNRLFFYEDSLPHRPLQYQFIITNNLSQQAIMQSVGKPDKIAVCDSLTVWMYLAPDSIRRLNYYFLSQFTIF